MKTKTNNEEAVSPVLATVLLVAMTIILAIMAMAMIFEIPGQIPDAKIVGVVVDRTTPSLVTSTFHGGPDAESLLCINWTVGTNPAITIQGTPGLTTPLPIGNSKTITAPINSHVVGVGWFMDGSQQVLVDATI